MRPSRWLLAAASGFLLVLAFPPFNAWMLAWVAFVPLYVALKDAPDAKAAANLGAVTGLAFYVPALHWLVKVFGPLGAAFWCAFALWLGLHAALIWWTAKRWRASHTALWIIAAGVSWIGIEYFRSEIWKLECSWLALGYSQVPHLETLGLCSLIGVYGLSGLTVMSNAAIAGIIFEKRGRYFAVLIAVILASHAVPRGKFFDGKEITVAAVQDETYSVAKMSRLSLGPEARGADLLVWPEYGFTVQTSGQERFRQYLAGQLKGTKAVAVLGAAIFPDDMRTGWEQNFAWLLGPDGALLGRYDKHHPIPFVETRLKANPFPQPVDTPLGRVGVQICYDLDFEDGSRLLQRQGAEIIVVPDLDPAEWTAWQHRQHSAMSSARAVESGLWIVRAASSGLSQIVAPDGSVRGQLEPLTSGVLVGEARMTAGGTFYTRFGWVLPKLCLLLTTWLIGWFAWDTYKTRKVKSRIS